jgi:hypothetical protein
MVLLKMATGRSFMRTLVWTVFLLAALAVRLRGDDVKEAKPVPMPDFATHQWKGMWGSCQVEIDKGQCKGKQGGWVLRGKKYVIETHGPLRPLGTVQLILEKGNHCRVIEDPGNDLPILPTKEYLGIYRWEPPGRLMLCIYQPWRPKVFPAEDERGLPTSEGKVCILDLVYTKPVVGPL